MNKCPYCNSKAHQVDPCKIKFYCKQCDLFFDIDDFKPEGINIR